MATKKLILPIALTLFTICLPLKSKAEPLTFNFSFTGGYSMPEMGIYDDTLKGYVILNDQYIATDVYLTEDIGGNVNLPLNFNFATNTGANYFAVQTVNGVPTITEAEFISYAHPTYALWLNRYYTANAYISIFAGVERASSQSLGNITFTNASAVPEPSTYGFMSIVALALAMAVRRRKSKVS